MRSPQKRILEGGPDIFERDYDKSNDFGVFGLERGFDSDAKPKPKLDLPLFDVSILFLASSDIGYVMNMEIKRKIFPIRPKLRSIRQHLLLYPVSESPLQGANAGQRT